MSTLPIEREIRFEMPIGSTTTVGYNPQALEQCANGLDTSVLFKEDQMEPREVREARNTLFECLIPTLYSFDCTAAGVEIEMPLTKQGLDDMAHVIAERIMQEIVLDLERLKNP